MRQKVLLLAISCLCLLGQMPSCLAQTGTFIDRHSLSDLRVVSYNVYRDTIFPNVSASQAAKFSRVINALNPDILNLQEIYGHTDTQVQSLLDTIAPLPGGTSWYVHRGGDNVIASKYPLVLRRTNTIPTGERSQSIALVDLPDELYPTDFYFMNNHFKCCGNPGGAEDGLRQRQSDAIVNWLRDARAPGENVDLAPGTPFAVLGDLNIVGGLQPLTTLLDGNIIDEDLYGNDSPPDWDGSNLTDAHPYHNGSQTLDYTWRDDNQVFDPGRLDFILYSDSALDVGNKFILNTVDMSSAQLTATGLEQFDITLDNIAATYDHLPVVVDFRIFDFAESDFNFSRTVDATDLATWQANFGTVSGATRAMGDANADGKVDGRDFLVWQRQFNGVSPFLAAVPEPSSLGLLVLSWAGFYLRMPRSRG